MNSRERVLTALSHREADRVPLDLGGMAQSGVHRQAYAGLRQRLGLPPAPIRVLNIITQAARMDEDLLLQLRVDTRLVYGHWADPRQAALDEEAQYWAYCDEWGIQRRMPREGGLYFDIHRHPFDVDNVDAVWPHYRWPDPYGAERYTGLRAEAERARAQGGFVVLMGLCPGIVEMYSWLRGFDRFYIDLATEPRNVHRFLSRIVELKAAYWERALQLVGDCVDAVNEADDLAGQDGLLLSPQTYRKLIKPYHRALCAAIRRVAPHVFILFHSCGAIRPLIPDLIEIGVDILNPVQVSARGMDPHELKNEFGRDLCFWGGGIDAQAVLGSGPLSRIKDDVRRNIETLAPGGGFVFAPTHIIQADVPPENVLAMWEALQQYGAYS